MENNATPKRLPAFVILAIIALVAALVLGVTNAVTEGPIAKLAQEELAASFRAVLPADTYESLDIPSEYKDVQSLAVAKDASGNVLGYCVKAAQTGYAGPVAVILGVDPNGQVTAAQIGDASFSETNGFGARWKEDANQGKLVGLSAVEDGAFEAISGATYTSKAVLGGANAALSAVAKLAMNAEPGTLAFGTSTASKSGGSAAAGSAAEPGATLEGTAAGFGGDVNVVLKLDDEAKIAEMKVEAANETPGLGARATEAEFIDQFIGKSLPVTLGEGIEAISGATITSTAVVDAVNTAQKASPFVPGATLEGSAQGFLGQVTAHFQLDGDAKIASMKIEAPDETPGLGARAAEDEFAGQFIGKSVPLTLGEDIEAISGATITSTAVVDAINGAHAVDAAPAVEAVTVLTEDKTGSLGVTESGSAKLTPVEGYSGVVHVALNVENGKVVSGELNPVAEEKSAPAEADAVSAEELTATVAGFQGDVTVHVTLDADGAVKTLTVDTPNETPGFGQRCSEEEFTAQFIGKKAPFTLGENVEALSGATITSTAVVEAMNAAVPAAEEPAKEEPAVEEPAKEEPAEEPKEEPAAEAPAADELTASAFGFQGDVTVHVTLDADGAVKTLTVDTPNETPGFGQRCSEEEFTAQFIGKKAPFTLGENVEALSGATITSTAVVEAMNAAVPAAEEPAKEEPAKEEPAEEPKEEPAAEAPAADELTASASGFQGDVTVHVTLDADGAVKTLTVDTPNETPGFGQRCSEEEFTAQFIGKKAPFTLGENVEALSGATITSTAVVEAMNAAVPAAEEPAKEEPAKEEPAKEEPAEEPKEEPAAEAPAADELMASASGFQGDVTVHVTLDADGAVKTLTVDTPNETPGFGQRCSEEEFTAQFIGKKAPFTLGENVEALSGATITSTAVVEAMNAAVPAAEEPAKEEPVVEEPAKEEPAEEPKEEPAAEAPAADELTASAFGFQGDVTVHVTLDADGAVKTLTVDTPNETPGFGQRCSEEEFTAQFIGKKAPFTLGENVEALSGATITSTAVVEAMNAAVAK